MNQECSVKKFTWTKRGTEAGRLKYQDIPKESFAYTVTTVIAGEVYERLYRGASSRNRILYYWEPGDSAADRKKIWSK